MVRLTRGYPHAAELDQIFTVRSEASVMTVAPAIPPRDTPPSTATFFSTWKGSLSVMPMLTLNGAENTADGIWCSGRSRDPESRKSRSVTPEVDQGPKTYRNQCEIVITPQCASEHVFVAPRFLLQAWDKLVEVTLTLLLRRTLDPRLVRVLFTAVCLKRWAWHPSQRAI